MAARRDATPEQIEFIRECMKTMSTRECARVFTEKFGEPLGQTQLRRYMKRNGITSTLKQNEFAPIGTEKYSDYYKCMMVKTGEYHVSKNDDPKSVSRKRNRNWQLKQNYVWETSTNSKLPKGWTVIFLDGNRMNYDPDNLFAVPLYVAGNIEKMNMHSESPQIYKTALIWGMLFFVIKRQKGCKSIERAIKYPFETD